MRGHQATRGYITAGEMLGLAIGAVEQVTDDEPVTRRAFDDAVQHLTAAGWQLLEDDFSSARIPLLDEIDAGDRNADGEVVSYDRYQAA